MHQCCAATHLLHLTGHISRAVTCHSPHPPTPPGKNFIVEASGLASDPFDMWIGDGTWMNLNLTLKVTDAGGGYLAFAIIP